ncbi:MAG: hypothetical protein RLZ75_738 [Pseudomonadota bacterium]|jgi:hypothetical protein
MIIFILAAMLINYQYTRTENVNKCISEKSNSSFCIDKINSYNESLKALNEAK